MRTALGLLTALLLVLGVHALASGDEPAPADEPAAGDEAVSAADAEAFKRLEARVEALELEAQYLRSREAALTRYILLNRKRSEGMNRVVAKAREQGFENNRIPAPSRITLLAGLDSLAGSMRSELPELTRAESSLLKKATAHRKLHQIGGR